MLEITLYKLQDPRDLPTPSQVQILALLHLPLWLVQVTISFFKVYNLKIKKSISDVEFTNMSLEIGPDLSPTFSFDRETSSGEKLITFKENLNPRTDFDQLSKLLATLLDEEEKKCMADLKQYLVKNEVNLSVISPKSNCA